MKKLNKNKVFQIRLEEKLRRDFFETIKFIELETPAADLIRSWIEDYVEQHKETVLTIKKEIEKIKK